jgi:carboxylesterase
VTTDPADAVLPGAEPFEADGDAAGAGTGILLCHGFTGSPQSLRSWAEYLADAGYRVSLPLLPGHGRTDWRALQATTWPDWYAELDKAFRILAAQCETVFVMGLSMGGGLALRLAAQHADRVAGVVVVNPSVKRNKPAELLLPVVSRLVPSLPGIASDIKKPDAQEVGYARVPLKAAKSLSEFWAVVQPELPRIVAPLLLFRSTEDHVVDPSNSEFVLDHVSSARKQEVLLHDSYHVATLDNDAPAIFEGSLAFVRELTGAGPLAAAAGAQSPLGAPDGPSGPEDPGAPR